jgi:hypothetical protein
MPKHPARHAPPRGAGACHSFDGIPHYLVIVVLGQFAQPGDSGLRACSPFEALAPQLACDLTLAFLACTVVLVRRRA